MYSCQQYGRGIARGMTICLAMYDRCVDGYCVLFGIVTTVIVTHVFYSLLCLCCCVVLCPGLSSGDGGSMTNIEIVVLEELDSYLSSLCKAIVMVAYIHTRDVGRC